jgi:hypothetical protein
MKFMGLPITDNESKMRDGTRAVSQTVCLLNNKEEETKDLFSY